MTVKVTTCCSMGRVKRTASVALKKINVAPVLNVYH